MNPNLLPLLATLLLLDALPAQCAALNGGTPITAWNWSFLNDDGISTDHIPLPFNFPIAGAAGATFTHLRVGSNGWVLLTDGTSNAGLPAPGSGGYGSTANSSNGLGGAAGDFPLLAPFWGDLVWSVGSANGVFVSYGSYGYTSCRVIWKNVRDYNSAVTGTYSFAVELFPSGEVRFHYGPNVDNRSTQSLTNYVGLSARNNQLVAAANDFFPGAANTTGGLLWQGFPVGSFDGAGSSLVLSPVVGGWVASVCSASPAVNVSHGAGCYDLPRSGFHQDFADAAAASAALQGSVLQLLRTTTSYTANWLPNVASALYVPPTAAAWTLQPGDDGFDTVSFSPPFRAPNGPVNFLSVAANGIVTLGYSSFHYGDRTPTGAEFAAAPGEAFYSWHDYDPTEAGSGQIKAETIGNALHITWEGVESRSTPPAANPSTMQFQFDLATGNVFIIWLSIDGDITSPDGSAHLVGVKGLGPVVDAGSQALQGTALPSSYWLLPLSLTVNAPLVYGSSVTFTTRNIPEFQPGSGLYVGLHVLSAGVNGGFDLGGIGAPGCSGYVNALDLTTTLIGTTPTVSNSLALPLLGLSGLQIFSQSVALALPSSLPNGQNTLGLVSSNGIRHALNYY